MRLLSVFFLLFFVVSSHAQSRFVVYFESNKSALTSAEATRLFDWMTQNPKVKIVAIEGYTDEDGSVRYNDSLAQARVNTIFGRVKSRIAIREDFRSRSFGEQHAQKGGKAANRRVNIYYLEEKDLARENEILGLPKQEVPAPAQTRIVTYPERITIQNPDNSKSEFVLNVEFMTQLSNATKGTILQMPEINFVLNTFAVENNSRGRLFELLMVMQKNPQLQIRIHGHICCVQKDAADLSTKRAKAIKQFLVHHGIADARVTFTGHGANQPKFPIPESTEEQRAANRRIEVEVL